MGDLHPLGELCDGAIGLNQVLDQVAIAVSNSLESSPLHAKPYQLVDAKAEKEPEIGDVQLGDFDGSFTFHNRGCVLYVRVGILQPDLVSRLPARCAAELEKFRWLQMPRESPHHLRPLQRALDLRTHRVRMAFLDLVKVGVVSESSFPRS